MAGGKLFASQDRPPKTFVISIRYRAFRPLDTRTDARWLGYVPEYRQMARRFAAVASLLRGHRRHSLPVRP